MKVEMLVEQLDLTLAELKVYSRDQSLAEMKV